MMPIKQDTVLTNDIIAFHILPLFGCKTLGRAQRLCMRLYLHIRDSDLWQALYQRTLNKPIDRGCAKEALFRDWRCITIFKEKDLVSTIQSFFCNLPYDKKRKLECHFPNEPTYFFSIQQGFGHTMGTPDNFNNSTDFDQIEYYKYMDPIPVEKEDYRLVSQESLSRIGPFAQVPLYKKLTFVTPQNNIPILFEKISNLFAIPRVFEVEIKKVNLSYGDRLGYCSTFNGWNPWIVLPCISENKGSRTWVGLIPHSVFKFIKIDFENRAIWESGEDRYWPPRPADNLHSFDEYMKERPIQFPD